ncbi:MAG: radical SAM protein, partial [Candidatus Omnitrophica bacterium]|nr:radical SAM protein [Candidatus Omnitrophota bacterium]
DGFKGSVLMAELLRREFPRLKIFAGGPVVDEGQETVLEVAPVFDALVYGDGEETIIDLVAYAQGKKTLSQIPNIIYKAEGTRIVKSPVRMIENLDDLPLPVYDENVYPSLGGNQKIKIAVVDESRGCPNRCYFCPHVEKSGGKWRLKSAQRIIREIKRLSEHYGIHAFRYAGSCTPAPVMKAVAEEIVKDHIDVVYTSFANAGISDAKSFMLLKESGLHALFFGVESGDQRLLHEVMNKKMLSPDIIRDTIRAAQHAGIFCVSSIIFPAPGETSQSRNATLELLKELYAGSSGGAVCAQFPGLFPGTAWYGDPARFGFKIRNPATYKEEMLEYKIKLFFPPSFWKPVPYTLDGKSYKTFSRETENFIKELDAHGILTLVTDEMALIARLLGLKPRAFRDHSRPQFFTGEWESLSKDLEIINNGATADAKRRCDIRAMKLED